MKKQLNLKNLKVQSFITGEEKVQSKGGATYTCKTIEATCEPCTGWWCPSDPERC